MGFLWQKLSREFHPRKTKDLNKKKSNHPLLSLPLQKRKSIILNLKLICKQNLKQQPRIFHLSQKKLNKITSKQFLSQKPLNLPNPVNNPLFDNHKTFLFILLEMLPKCITFQNLIFMMKTLRAKLTS